MDQMSRCCGGGGLSHRLSLHAQGRGAGRAMSTLPLFLRSRAHLAKTAGAHLAEPPKTAGAHLVKTSGAHLADDAEPPKTAGAHLAKTAGAHLAEPPFCSLAHHAKFPMTAATLQSGRSMRFGVRLNCYASNGGSEAPSSDDESASSLRAHVSKPAAEQPKGGEPSPSSVSLEPPASSRDLLQVQLHGKMELLLHRNVMGARWLIWRMIAAVLSVLLIFLMIGMLYIVANGRSYLEEEMKVIFLSITNDPKIKERLQKIVKDGVDTSVYYISSGKTWYKWYQVLRERGRGK